MVHGMLRSLNWLALAQSTRKLTLRTEALITSSLDVASSAYHSAWCVLKSPAMRQSVSGLYGRKKFSVSCLSRSYTLMNSVVLSLMDTAIARMQSSYFVVMHGWRPRSFLTYVAHFAWVFVGKNLW